MTNIFRVPENKQHMVLPEIEEEEEDEDEDESSARRHSKLSLTSLLLGKEDKYVYTPKKWSSVD